MRNSLAVKLILAFLAVAITAAVLVAVFVRRSTADELYRVILEQQTDRLRANLIRYYHDNGTWDGVAQFVSREDPLPPPPPNPNIPAPPPSPDRLHFGVTDPAGRVFLPWANVRLGDTVPKERLREAVPLVVDEATVGYFFVDNFNTFASPEATAYLDHTDRALVWATSGAILLALVLGALLTRSLLRPIRDLTRATQALTQGKRGEQIVVWSGDELGRLTTAFNQMSKDLARAEQARRQMTADVAHDLRTPLTVLSAYIEAFSEGVLPPTAERFEVMQTEIDHLSHLVEDLMTLAKADAGEIVLKRQPVVLAELLNRTVNSHALQAQIKGITLGHHLEPNLPTLRLDEQRMVQVLSKLVSNAIRHTPTGGRIDLAALQSANSIKLSVSDNGEGIAAEALPLVFDRFFRADKARSVTGEESGLGLAIAKSLVEAHGGTLAVTSQVGRGTQFSILFKAA